MMLREILYSFRCFGLFFTNEAAELDAEKITLLTLVYFAVSIIEVKMAIWVEAAEPQTKH